MAISIDALKAKAGPLPVWVWALLTGVGGLFLFYMVRGRAQVNSSGTSPNATTSTDPYAAFANYSAAPTTTDQGASAPTSMETNTSWLAKAVAWLTTQGVKPLDAQAALLNYQNNGGALDPAQTSIVNKALNQFGLPPEGVYGIPTGTAPTPPPTTTPTPPAGAATFKGFIKAPNGTIAATFSDGTREDFSSMAAYLKYQAKHPGAYKNVSAQVFNGYKVTAQNPTP